MYIVELPMYDVHSTRYYVQDVGARATIYMYDVPCTMYIVGLLVHSTSYVYLVLVYRMVRVPCTCTMYYVPCTMYYYVHRTSYIVRGTRYKHGTRYVHLVQGTRYDVPRTLYVYIVLRSKSNST